MGEFRRLKVLGAAFVVVSGVFLMTSPFAREWISPNPLLKRAKMVVGQSAEEAQAILGSPVEVVAPSEIEMARQSGDSRLWEHVPKNIEADVALLYDESGHRALLLVRDGKVVDAVRAD